MDKNCFVGRASLITVLLLLPVSSITYGAALGLPPGEPVTPNEEIEKPDTEQPVSRVEPVQSLRTSRIGYGIGFSSITVDDKEGSTNKTSTLQPVTLIYTDRLWNSTRYWSEFYYYKATLDAKVNKVGQDVQRYGIRLSMQKNIFTRPRWSAWVGAGIDLSQVTYSARHTVDSDGFLLDVLPKKEELTTVGILNIFTEWTMSPVWTLGAKFEQSLVGNGHIKDSLLAMSALYRY